MTTPTHTHKERGGRWQAVNSYSGSGPLEGQSVVVLHDLDKDVTSVTTYQDWSDNWRPIAADDCPVCLGAGTDHIKGNKAHPCGGCYGLGKVRQDGETPADRWELAEVALGIMSDLRCAVARAEGWLGMPEVARAIEAHQQAARDASAQHEQQWRDGRGKGPLGRRMTGD